MDVYYRGLIQLTIRQKLAEQQTRVVALKTFRTNEPSIVPNMDTQTTVVDRLTTACYCQSSDEGNHRRIEPDRMLSL